MANDKVLHAVENSDFDLRYGQEDIGNVPFGILGKRRILNGIRQCTAQATRFSPSILVPRYPRAENQGPVRRIPW